MRLTKPLHIIYNIYFFNPQSNITPAVMLSKRFKPVGAGNEKWEI